MNKQGNVTKETWEDGDTVVYEYDNNDALGSVTDSATGITTRYFYDLSQRLAKYRETGTGLDHSVTYSYDARNNLSAHTEVINGATRKTTFTYDTDNRVTQVYNSDSASGLHMCAVGAGAKFSDSAARIDYAPAGFGFSLELS